MAAATLLSLRDRLPPPAGSDPRGAGSDPRGTGPDPRGGAVGERRPEGLRALDLAASLFGVASAALVLARPDGLVVAAASGGVAADEAVAAACRLFEALAAAAPPVEGRPAGVVEEIMPGRGFAAATPILSPAGRCLGAVCLIDSERRTLLTGMQRRLFAEFGDLLLPTLDAAPAADDDARLQALADAEPDAFALLDGEGRCLLRNARFAELVGEGSRPAAGRPELAAARGREAGWIAGRLARDLAPVGVTRAARPDGTWLIVEERRGPHGRSLLARVEGRDAFGGDGDLALLFERCPAPMFVYDRDTSALLAANDAALAFYGWEREAFLRLDLDRIGPVGPAPRGWTHRARDGRALAVRGHTVGLTHRGRPAVLVTLAAEPAEAAVTDRAA